MSVIVPVFNKAPLLGPCIDSLLRAVDAYGVGELIVVDHGSTDGSRDILESRCGGKATILELRGGTISAARNLGALQASGLYLSFIDADCVVARDHLSKLVAVFLTTPTEVTGCRVGLPESPTWVEEVWYRMHLRDGDGPRSYINSGNFAVSRRAFDLVGGFNEQLVTGEDAEICQRLTDAGFRPFEAKRLAVAHLDNAKTLRQFLSKEIWHGLGMLGTVRAKSLDKPTALLVVHIALMAAAVGTLMRGPGPVAARIGTALALALFAPACAVTYRAFATGRIYRPLAALVLYEIYFFARAVALVRIAIGRGGRLRRPRATGTVAAPQRRGSGVA